MFLFHLGIAVRSLKSTPRVSLICILAIGMGIGIATSFTTIFHIFDQNPLPEKSERIFNVRIDGWDPNGAFFGVTPGDPPKSVTYQDMTGMMGKGPALAETGVANAQVYVFPEDHSIKPWQTVVHLVHADFFGMFQVPFRFGSGWSRGDDQNRTSVVVLSESCNQRLFGGRNSVGETVKLGAKPFQVIGILDSYNPTPMVFDPVNALSGPPREFYLPFDQVREPACELTPTMDGDSWGSGPFTGDFLYTTAEFYWIQYWVELEPQKVAEFGAFVDQYVAQIKAAGRHPRPANSRVTKMMDWVHDRSAIRGLTKGLTGIAMLFLMACALNLMGLLLGKFLSRAGRIGVHRALGATRGAIFIQHILECEIVGLLGGLVGIGLAFAFLTGIANIMPTVPNRFSSNIFSMDLSMLIIAVLLSLFAGLIAGLYPAWRACRVAPVVQLKL